jgi:predicted  nucleic acid-binding Zn-ribbon protein
MHPQLETLLLLQNRDQTLKSLRAEQKSVPLERARVESHLESERARVASLRDGLRSIEVERKSLELDVQARQESINKFRAQQAQTRRNEEFQALHHEIDRFSKMIRDTEDRELEVMERAETARATLAAAEEQLAAVEKQSAAALEMLTARASALETRIAETEAEKASVGQGIDADLLQRYVRLFASKGDAAVVPVEHGVCMGCHMKVTTQTLVFARAGQELTGCPQCGRLLYCEE